MPTALLACLDGVVGPPADARISATDEGLLRGDGAFEVICLYRGRPYALEQHLARLARSAESLRLPFDLDTLRGDVTRLLAAAVDIAAEERSALRIVVTRGGRRLLLVESSADYDSPIRLATVTYAPTRVLDGVKSLSYAANMLTTRLAQEQGFDEALLVTPHGRVLEAPTSSFFWVQDGVLRTPPLSDHILASITRADVIDLTGAEEQSCTLEDLATADEAFLASTLREVQPIVAIDEHELPADGPVTREAARRVRERIVAALG